MNIEAGLTKVRGIYLCVYSSKSLSDCSNEGISSRWNRLFFITPDGIEETVASLEVPAVCIDRHPTIYNHPICHEVRFLDGYWQKDRRWAMFGGNFAYTSDSRFAKALQAITGSPYSQPVAIWDRFE